MRMVYCIFLWVMITACNDVKVGYLLTENAKYDPDTLIVKKTLDPVIDADRMAKKYNWVTLPMDGIEGTQPILFTIHSVATEGGDVSQFLKDVKVRGNGTFDVSFNNVIPAGTYKITLKVENEGYSDILKDVFTIVVQP